MLIHHLEILISLNNMSGLRTPPLINIYSSNNRDHLAFSYIPVNLKTLSYACTACDNALVREEFEHIFSVFADSLLQFRLSAFRFSKKKKRQNEIHAVIIPLLLFL